MKIDKETVYRVASLAKLQFNEEEVAQLEEDLTKIVTYFEKMDELDTEGVEPLVFLTDEINAFREDEAEIIISHEEALKNAPERNSDYFKVPKFMEKDS